MGKKGGISWLTVVKRAFKSPSKDDKKGTRRREEGEHEEEEEEEKKREKRRWLFKKPVQQCEAKVATAAAPVMVNPSLSHAEAEQSRAIAAAAATTAAAVATAQAAVEIIRLTRPSSSVGEQYAAIVIQTAFRGYLARRALQALKGIVKLQALVRGHNVRKQAKTTLKCMQALLRVQTRVRDQRARLSHEGTRKSMFAETNNLWESRYLRDIRERKSTSRAGSSCIADDWEDCPRTLEELDAFVQMKKEAALKREKTLADAFSQQIWDSGRINRCSGDEREADDRTNWLERWMATKQWESSGRSSADRRENIKVLEIDASGPYHRCCSSSTPSLGRASHKRQSSLHFVASPHHHRASYTQTPVVTPSPAKMRPLQVRSASPRCFKEETSFSTANTPHGINGAMPNYMAATESAKARLRSQSATRQRPSTPERERGGGSAKKRLSYLVPEAYGSCVGNGCSGSFSQNLTRSPSFKSVQAGFLGVEQRSCYTDSIGGEISPCSTTDLRRWLR